MCRARVAVRHGSINLTTDYETQKSPVNAQVAIKKVNKREEHEKQEVYKRKTDERAI